MNDKEYMARICQMERRLYRIAHAILWEDSDCADAIQEAIFRGWVGRASLREKRRCTSSSKLEDGTENHHRLCDPYE